MDWYIAKWTVFSSLDQVRFHSFCRHT